VDWLCKNKLPASTNLSSCAFLSHKPSVTAALLSGTPKLTWRDEKPKAAPSANLISPATSIFLDASSNIAPSTTTSAKPPANTLTTVPLVFTAAPFTVVLTTTFSPITTWGSTSPTLISLVATVTTVPAVSIVAPDLTVNSPRFASVFKRII